MKDEETGLEICGVPNSETLAAMKEADEISRNHRARFSRAEKLFFNEHGNMYTICIGNAMIEQNLDGIQLLAEWVVDVVTNDRAPEFPNDQLTGKSNVRMSGYSAWEDFCKKTGLYRLFYGDEGLIAHPGCAKINKGHVSAVRIALLQRHEHRLKNGIVLRPGFGAENDYTLARLLWLEYWMTWAVENCEIPAIENR